MAGLVPAIHVFEFVCVSRRAPGHFVPGAWMPGTRPGMTGEAQPVISVIGTSPTSGDVRPMSAVGGKAEAMCSA